MYVREGETIFFWKMWLLNCNAMSMMVCDIVIIMSRGELCVDEAIL